ncbi:MAG: PqqD family protein [Omnitrophica bacterium]|nr:PqqD family protein [Candidatus Omnitrophota bacterium]
MLTLDSCIGRNNDVPWRIIEEEAVLVSVDRGEVIHLNSVGAQIWNSIESKTKVSEIIEYIYETFDVDKDAAAKDALEFLKRLKEARVIDVS